MARTEAEKAAFKEKLRYWRENGAFGVRFQGGREFWNSTTVRTEQERIVAEGKAHGNDLVPAKGIWGN